MKPALTIFSFLFSLVLFLVVAGSANAAQFTNMLLTPGSSKATTSNIHTFTFTHPTAATLMAMEFKYCTTPSAADGSCTKPTSLSSISATKGTITGLTGGSWSLLTGTNGTPYLEFVATGSGEFVNTNTSMSISLNGIVNHEINDCQPGGDDSSDTCYVRVKSFNSTSRVAGNIIDQGVASYTVVEAIAVTARVDPIFTFVVAGTLKDQVFNAITTSADSEYGTLPFGNVTANVPKYVAHKLTVTTNTENGYTITQKMTTAMTGVYAANNIDPLGNGATWANPAAWSSPNGGTSSVDTGWIGANTTDTDVANFSPQEFGPVNSSANIVMQGDGSDNGATAIYVTYGLEANVFQPADLYTGELVYTALPTY